MDPKSVPINKLKTLGSRLRRNAPAHAIHMKIASLEMQSHRCDIERAACEKRIRQCEQRAGLLRAEIDRLMADLAKRFPNSDAAQEVKPPHGVSQSSSSTGQPGRTIGLRY